MDCLDFPFFVGAQIAWTMRLASLSPSKVTKGFSSPSANIVPPSSTLMRSRHLTIIQPTNQPTNQPKKMVSPKSWPVYISDWQTIHNNKAFLKGNQGCLKASGFPGWKLLGPMGCVFLAMDPDEPKGFKDPFFGGRWCQNSYLHYLLHYVTWKHVILLRTFTSYNMYIWCISYCIIL